MCVEAVAVLMGASDGGVGVAGGMVGLWLYTGAMRILPRGVDGSCVVIARERWTGLSWLGGVCVKGIEVMEWWGATRDRWCRFSTRDGQPQAVEVEVYGPDRRRAQRPVRQVPWLRWYPYALATFSLEN